MNTGSSAVGKGTAPVAAKNASTVVGKGTNTTPTMNVAPTYTAPKASTPSAPAMNMPSIEMPKASTPNPVPAATYNPDAVGKGGYVTAAPDKYEINSTTLDDYLTPGYNAAVSLAGGAGNNPTLANMAPHERTRLWMSVLGSAPGIAGSSTNGFQTLLDAVTNSQSNKGVRRLSQASMNPGGYDELGKEERSFEERPYSNPNFGFDNLGFSDTRMQDLDRVGKYDYSQAPINSLLDALTSGPVDSDIRPYRRRNKVKRCKLLR